MGNQALVRRWALFAVAAAALLGWQGAGGFGRGLRPPDSLMPGAPVVAAEQVRSLPHDTTAFTQGLLVHDGVLYESAGRYRESRLRKLDPASGAVLAEERLLPQFFAEGLAVHHGRLHLLTWNEKVLLLHDPRSLAPMGRLPYPGEGWGLTSDGDRLIASDGSELLRFFDPETLTQLGAIEVRDGAQPVRGLNELEWVDGELWANLFRVNRIARINPFSGEVKGWIDLAQLVPGGLDEEAVPNGIAWDRATGRVYVTGKLWPVIYEIRRPTGGEPARS